MALEYFAMQRGGPNDWRCPGPFAAKQTQIITFPSPRLTVCMLSSVLGQDFGLQSSDATLQAWPCCFFCFASFKHRKGFLLATLQNKQYSFSLVLIVLSWILSFALLTVVCRVWDGIFALSDHSMVWHWGDFAGMLTPGNTGNHLQCFPLVDFLFTL